MCRFFLIAGLIAPLLCLEISESTGEKVECAKSKVDHNVTLAGGQNAGSFLKANGSITTMPMCVKQCCQMKGCDIAFFSNGVCYSVKCNDVTACAPKRNADKRMRIAISYVAKTRRNPTESHSSDETGEPAIEDNLIAEVVLESPFLHADQVAASIDSQDDSGEVELLRSRQESWKETKDMAVAIICGFVAVMVGIMGVITMTRKLTEDDDDVYVEEAIKPGIERIGGARSKNTFVRKEETDRAQVEQVINMYLKTSRQLSEAKEQESHIDKSDSLSSSTE